MMVNAYYWPNLHYLVLNPRTYLLYDWFYFYLNFVTVESETKFRFCITVTSLKGKENTQSQIVTFLLSIKMFLSELCKLIKIPFEKWQFFTTCLVFSIYAQVLLNKSWLFFMMIHHLYHSFLIYVSFDPYWDCVFINLVGTPRMNSDEMTYQVNDIFFWNFYSVFAASETRC